MPVQQGVWGIDVGQSALKALRLEVIDGVVTATAFDFVEHPKILSQPDADPDQLTREALEKFLSRNDIKGDQVAISVPGQSGLARFVKLPPVEEKKIGDIVRFEAKQQIPFPLDEVVWDFQKIGAGEVTDGFAMETEIGLFAMKRDQINRSLAHFQDVKVEVHYIQMAPLALCNYVAYDLLNRGGTPPAEGAEEPAADEGPRGKRRCVVALDIGTDSSNLVITDGEKIIWQRPIPLGGNHLTRALSKELKLTFAKAEHLKRNAAKSPPELKTILAALKPVLTDFVGEVQRSLGFFTNTHRDAQIQYMVGLGSAFRLPGFQKYLSEKLQLDVRKPNAFNRLVGEEVVNAPVFTENVLSYSVAYGLAVQGLGLAKLRTNLLPHEIQRDRMIRAKKPWALAAASAFFLGTTLLTGGYAINYNAVSAKPIKDAMAKAETELSKVNTQNSTASEKEQKIKELADQVKGVIAGKDEQLDWILLNQYINQCLPQPDGSNLRFRKQFPFWGDQVPYWNTQEAKDALEQYRERIRGGQSADQPMPDEARANLVQMDIEAVDSRYTDNLKAFFDRAQQITTAANLPLSGMCSYDKNNPPKESPPEGAGWVIEVRGSTYQKDNRQFIIDALVQNLARFSRKTLPLVGDAPAGGAAPADAAATPAPTTPAPAPDAAAATAPAAAEKVDPIQDRISHVFLYNYWTDPDPKPATFQLIQASHLPEVLAPAAGALGGGPSGAPGAAPGGPTGGSDSGPGGFGSPRDAWQPLTGAGGNASPGGFPGGGPSGGPSGFPGGFTRGFGGRGKGFGLAGVGGGPSSGGPPTGGPPPITSGGPTVPGTPVAKKPKPRYEFIVMFIWREPTPSDQLMKLGDAIGGAAAGATPGGP